MGFFTRALAGVGGAAAGMANKYIDEELMQQRAAALAEIQIKTAATMRADADAFNSDPTRVARDRANAVANEEAIGGAKNRTALAGEEARATSKTLQQAAIDNQNAVVLGTVDAQIKAANAIMDGTAPAKLKAKVDEAAAMLPLEIKKAYAVADAHARATQSHQKTPGAEFAAKLEVIRNTLGRDLTEPEKLGLLGITKATRDPELDTETVVREKMNPDGTVTKTTSKQVRRPGQGGGDESPYADGTELRDKNNKVYVVKDGQPVPKDAGGGSLAAKAAARAPAGPTPSEQIGMERLVAAAAPKGYTQRGKMFQKGGTGPLYTPEELAKELGLEW